MTGEFFDDLRLAVVHSSWEVWFFTKEEFILGSEPKFGGRPEPFKEADMHNKAKKEEKTILIILL